MAEVEAQGPAHFSSLVDRFKNNPSPEAPPTNAPNQPTYDAMLLSLMLQIWEEAKKNGVEKDDPKLNDALVSGLKGHLAKINQEQERLRREVKKEEDEQHSKITSEDIHDGFDSHVSPILSFSCITKSLSVPIARSTSLPNPAPLPSKTRSSPTSPRRP